MKITIDLSSRDLKSLREFNEMREAVGYRRTNILTDRLFLKVADAVRDVK